MKFTILFLLLAFVVGKNSFFTSVLVDPMSPQSVAVGTSAVDHEVFVASALKARVHKTSAFRASPRASPSDIRLIMSTFEGSFVFIIHPN